MDARGRLSLAVAAVALVLGLGGAAGTSAAAPRVGSSLPSDVVTPRLTPPNAALAARVPKAKLDVTVRPRIDEIGFDLFEIHASNLPPRRSYTVFLLETAGRPSAPPRTSATSAPTPSAAARTPSG